MRFRRRRLLVGTTLGLGLLLAGLVWWSWPTFVRVRTVDTELDGDVRAVDLRGHVGADEELVYRFRVGAAGGPEPADDAIGTGRWRLTVAGTGEFIIDLQVQSQGLVQTLHPVTDHFHSVVDPRTAWTRRYRATIREGTYSRRDDYRWREGAWWYTRGRYRDGTWQSDPAHALVGRPPGVCDPLAALLRLRAMPELLGARITVLDRKAVAELRVRGVEERSWTVPASITGPRQRPALALRLALYRQRGAAGADGPRVEETASDRLTVLVDAATRVPLQLRLEGVPVLGVVAADLVQCRGVPGW